MLLRGSSSIFVLVVKLGPYLIVVIREMIIRQLFTYIQTYLGDCPVFLKLSLIYSLHLQLLRDKSFLKILLSFLI